MFFNFQALQNKIYSLVGIRRMFEEKMRSQRIVDQLYINNIALKDFRKHTEPYVQHIFNFIEYYVKGSIIFTIDTYFYRDLFLKLVRNYFQVKV